MTFHDFYRRDHKGGNNNPPQALFSKTNIQIVMPVVKKMLVWKRKIQRGRRPSSVVRRHPSSVVRRPSSVVVYRPSTVVRRPSWSVVIVRRPPSSYMKLHNGPLCKHSAHSPKRVQKEEIQQWRQARSRPRGKETLNIMLREKQPPK